MSQRGASDGDEDDYGDDFESYSDDDFEEDEEPERMPPPRPQAATSSVDGRAAASHSGSLDDIIGRNRVRRRPTALGSTTEPSSPTAVESSPFAPAAPPQASQSPPPASTRTYRRPAQAARAAPAVRVRDPRLDRAQAMRQAIALNEERVDLFHQAPLGNVDRYHRSLLAGRIRQMTVQTNGDAKAVGLQTEPVETMEATAQCPEDAGFRRRKRAGKSPSQHSTLDSLALSRFLARVVGPMEALCDENVAEASLANASELPAHSLAKPQALSDANNEPIFQLNGAHEFPRWLRGRRVTATAFGGTNCLLAVAYSPSSDHTVHESSAAVAVLWECLESPTLKHILASPSPLTVLCLGARGAGHIVIGGTAEGSLVAWDLREPAHLHETTHPAGDREGKEELEKEDQTPCRWPSYATHTVLDGFDRFRDRAGGAVPGHRAPMTRCHIVTASAGDDASKVGTGPLRGLSSSIREAADSAGRNTADASFQVVSMDASGLVVVWVVLQLPQGADRRHWNVAVLRDSFVSSRLSEVDLGLRVGSRIKVTRAATLDPAVALARVTAPHATLHDAELEERKTLPMDQMGHPARDMACFTDGSGAVLVAGADGKIGHIQRNGLPALPRAFRHASLGELFPDCVDCMDASSVAVPWTHIAPCPQIPGVFAAAAADGSVHVFQRPRSEPTLSWAGVMPHTDEPAGLLWSACRPGVLLLLDTGGALRMWDLLLSTAGPAATVRIAPPAHSQHKSCKAWTFVDANTSLIPRGLLATVWTGTDVVYVHRLHSTWLRRRRGEIESVRNILLQER